MRAIRAEVDSWRRGGYAGVSDTSRFLLTYWFATEHQVTDSEGNSVPFRYHWAQREAIETIIYLYELRNVHNIAELLFEFGDDQLADIALGILPEEDRWGKYCAKIATGGGKTKVMSLAVVWSYFHSRYETNSALAQHFVVIAPNLTVYERLKDDFGITQSSTAIRCYRKNGSRIFKCKWCCKMSQAAQALWEQSILPISTVCTRSATKAAQMKPDDLRALREMSRELDSNNSAFRCVVSVMMLREGWDVRNVTTIVPLRPYSAKSGILPEQTLGRGLRRMFSSDQNIVETVTVVHHPAFRKLYEDELAQEGLDIAVLPIREAIKQTVTIFVNREKKAVDTLEIELPHISDAITTTAELEGLTFDAGKPISISASSPCRSARRKQARSNTKSATCSPMR